MDALKAERTILRTSFTKCCNKIREDLKEDKSKEHFSILQKQLVDKHSRLENIQKEITQQLLSTEEAEGIEEDFEQAENYRDKFSEISARLEGKITQKEAAPQVQENKKFQLPTLQIKKFNGDSREYLGFWSQFQKIHKDPAIPDEDKFQYLLQAVVPGSKAARLVESFPPTSENYKKCISQLQMRFGNEELLVQIYVRDLLNIVIRNSTKNNIDISELYDELSCKLMCLESLGRTKEKFADFLAPLVESCIPEKILKIFERTKDEEGESSSRTTLDKLMDFLHREVKGQEFVKLSRSGLMFHRGEVKSKTETSSSLPTGAALVNIENSGKRKICIFCSKVNHFSSECFIARKMSLQEKKNLLTKKNACFRCLNIGHSQRSCRNNKIKCLKCNNEHYVIMCSSDVMKVNENSNEIKSEKVVSNSLTNQCMNNQVYLQTLAIKVVNGGKELIVRALIDSASQFSYITQNLVDNLNLKPKGKQTLVHGLFGGRETHPQNHWLYDIDVANISNDFKCKVEVLSENKICGFVPRVNDLLTLCELKQKGIEVSDLNFSDYNIDVLLGANIIANILSSNCMQLNSGLTVVETKLGNTLLGKVNDLCNEHKIWSVPSIRENIVYENVSLLSISLNNLNLREIWDLDVIGIRDPIENTKQNILNSEMYIQFKNELKILPDGRYEVSLPFKSGIKIPDNKTSTLKRHKRMMQIAIDKNYIHDYIEVFRDWERLEIIEKVVENKKQEGVHYLSHRPVINMSRTTMCRPVFDASARQGGNPSLNDCLFCGPNLIEQIPDVLERFRVYPIGLSADVEKAFLQISISPQHRDYLRFFFPSLETETEYRHRRLPFGLNASPFILSASINHLLENAFSENIDIVSKLKHSFYVDNCVSGVFDEREIKEFILTAEEIMRKGCFNLRGWESNAKVVNKDEKKETKILGLIWNLENDTLKCSINDNALKIEEKITKRSVLSLMQMIFDPLGILTPVTLLPKLWLQELWKIKLSWDDTLPKEMGDKFQKWVSEICLLNEVEISRYNEINENSELHVFVDACKYAYAACVFVRTVTNGKIKIYFLRAKSRVCPIKKVTIPRLELLACSIGARLAHAIKNALDQPTMKTTLWTDSMVALWWIKNRGEWSIFVSNRVKEINEIAPKENWRHVPGSLNHGDLISRGCSPRQLIESNWLKGPEWLLNSHETWPDTEINSEPKETNTERRKTNVCYVNTHENINPWYATKFSNFASMIRVIAWMKRFVNNCRVSVENREKGELSVDEIKDAEKSIILSIQNDFFPNPKAISPINAFKGEDKLLYVRTKITEREDNPNFITPILIPSDCLFTKKLIEYHHRKNCHAGTQMLLSILRENFWILKARKTVRKVVRDCVRCKRFTVKPPISEPVTLPEDRVKDANVFQVIGIDLAGPLFLKNDGKVWIIIFTCAIFRAVHLDLVTSLSTDNFLLAFRRFIARRGRPATVYTDNGTNFRGANRELQNLDWDKIERETQLERISWKFNPPSAAWWGGWWERIVRTLKELLRRTLGNSVLNYEELLTVLCDCESIINSRPLTYMSEDSNDLIPLTPAMFLMQNSSTKVFDLDLNDSLKLQKRIKYRKKLINDLRCRFRREYLSMLVQKRNDSKSYQFSVGEIVLIGDDNKKRINWPLAKVLKIIPGKDKKVRTLQVKCNNSILIRPVQRVFPLEISSPDLEQQITASVGESLPLPSCEKNSRPELQPSVSPPIARQPESSSYCQAPSTSQLKSSSEGVKPKDIASEMKTRCGRVSRMPKRLGIEH